MGYYYDDYDDDDKKEQNTKLGFVEKIKKKVRFEVTNILRDLLGDIQIPEVLKEQTQKIEKICKQQDELKDYQRRLTKSETGALLGIAFFEWYTPSQKKPNDRQWVFVKTEDYHIVLGSYEERTGDWVVAIHDKDGGLTVCTTVEERIISWVQPFIPVPRG